MHLATLLPLTTDYCRIATTFLSTTGNLAPLAPVDPYGGVTESPWDFTTLRGVVELIGGSFCLLTTIGLVIYFTYAHHQISLNMPKGLRRKSHWTTDQINACLITFAIAVMFFLIHYSWQ